MTWFRVGGAGIPATLKNAMNAVFNKKFGTSGQNYPPKQWPDDVNLLGPLPEKTVAGAIAHTDDAADTVPVKSVICSIVPKQAGTGTPSPTNPRAISGYTGLTISQRGKNLMQNKTYQRQAGNLRLGTDTLDGRLSLKAGTYTISFDSDVAIGQVYYVLEGGTAVSIGATTSGTKVSGSFTLSSDTTDIFIYVYRSSGITADNISNLQLEVGSSASSFEAYNAAADISDSWSSIGAIYGGERDLTEGTLKDQYGIVTLSESMIDNAITYTYQEKVGIQISAVFPVNVVRQNVQYSSHDLVKQGADSATHYMWFGSSTGNKYLYWIGILDELQMTLEQFKVWAKTQTIQLCYKLPTEVSYSNLSTYDFETLYAVNNFYSDIEGGQTQLIYRQDIALALQAVSSSRGLMMASRPVTQLIGEESDPDQVNELVENDETEQEGEDNAR